MAAYRFASSLLAKASDVRVLLLDVDGVMTDGGLYFCELGESSKRFNTLDGHGLKLLQRAGIKPVVITGRDSPALRTRLSGLQIEHAQYGVADKRVAADQCLQHLGVTWTQTAAMGDDWPDLSMMKPSLLAFAPANAHPEVMAVAHHVTQAKGGEGAVREVCDLLLLSSGHYEPFLKAAMG
ncbi:MAG: 3-deoxy-D-manno-octulosonate 8-phosphate phosphatase [Betaproteobacteria bacterium]|nr:3-deoxy-D-manno-octulosonate 8-phosphate phosphatase [Betaproteobacteria bacterium]